MPDHDDFAVRTRPGLPESPAGGRRDPLARAARHCWRAGPEALRPVLGRGLFRASRRLARRACPPSNRRWRRPCRHGLPFLVLGAARLRRDPADLAWMQARATVYTITTARVAMRIGAALTMTLNLPLPAIATAGLDLRPRRHRHHRARD